MLFLAGCRSRKADPKADPQVYGGVFL